MERPRGGRMLWRAESGDGSGKADSEWPGDADINLQQQGLENYSKTGDMTNEHGARMKSIREDYWGRFAQSHSNIQTEAVNFDDIYFDYISIKKDSMIQGFTYYKYIGKKHHFPPKKNTRTLGALTPIYPLEQRKFHSEFHLHIADSRVLVDNLQLYNISDGEP